MIKISKVLKALKAHDKDGYTGIATGANKPIESREQELVEKIAKRICTLNPRVNSWESLDVFVQGAWRGEARQILALLEEDVQS
mgnify:CR=1 FL=1